MKNIYLTFALLLFCPTIYSQNQTKSSDYYKAFDSIVGIENTNLINGIRFSNTYRTTEETDHRFFKTHTFLKGSVVYDGQPYYNLQIKYDIYEDNVVLKLAEEKNYFDLKIDTDKVSAFTIDNHSFKNFSNNNSLLALGFQGFLEPIHEGKSRTLFVKHQKSRRESIKKTTIFSSYKSNNKYLFFEDGEFYEVKSRNNLKKIFPEKAKTINEFYSDNNLLLKRDFNDFIIKLFKILD